MQAPQRDESLWYDGLIVDLDGVVWLGSEPIRGSADALNELSVRGIATVFLTK